MCVCVYRNTHRYNEVNRQTCKFTVVKISLIYSSHLILSTKSYQHELSYICMRSICRTKDLLTPNRISLNCTQVCLIALSNNLTVALKCLMFIFLLLYSIDGPVSLEHVPPTSPNPPALPSAPNTHTHTLSRFPFPFFLRLQLQTFGES